jgi:hypothetical protein
MTIGTNQKLVRRSSHFRNSLIFIRQIHRVRAGGALGTKTWVHIAKGGPDIGRSTAVRRRPLARTGRRRRARNRRRWNGRRLRHRRVGYRLRRWRKVGLGLQNRNRITTAHHGSPQVGSSRLTANDQGKGRFPGSNVSCRRRAVVERRSASSRMSNHRGGRNLQRQQRGATGVPRRVRNVRSRWFKAAWSDGRHHQVEETVSRHPCCEGTTTRIYGAPPNSRCGIGRKSIDFIGVVRLFPIDRRIPDELGSGLDR